MRRIVLCGAILFSLWLSPVLGQAMAQTTPNSTTSAPPATSSSKSVAPETKSPAQDKPATSGFTLKPTDRVLGQMDAPVTMVEYASLTCPHCAEFHTKTLPLLKQEYISTGKMRLVFRDYPLDQWGLNAAVLARCADKTRYYGLLGLLYQMQSQWTQSSDPGQSLKQIGALAGVTPALFDSCMKNKELESQIAADRLEAEQKHGITSTPSFLLYGPGGQEQVTGNQPYPIVKAAIDRVAAIHK